MSFVVAILDCPFKTTGKSGTQWYLIIHDVLCLVWQSRVLEHKGIQGEEQEIHEDTIPYRVCVSGIVTFTLCSGFGRNA